MPISNDTWTTITDGMAAATTPGLYHTAEGAHIQGVDFAGKTGTAQVVGGGDTHVKGGERTPNSWFVGMVPRRNPEFAVVVLQEHGDWGSNSAHIAQALVITYVNKMRRQDHNLSSRPASPTSPLKWGQSGPPRPRARAARPPGRLTCCTPGTSSSPPAQPASALPMQSARLRLAALHAPRPLAQGSPLMRRFMSFRDFDWGLLLVVLLLCTVSVMEIYSATLHTKYADGHFHEKQLFYIGSGLAAMFLFSKIDYHKLIDLSPWLYGFFLLTLMAVLVPGIGHKALGARRWIKLGPMQFQPSEWMKLVIILAGRPLLRQPRRPLPHLEGNL